MLAVIIFQAFLSGLELTMSEDPGASSGEECALRIDTEQRKNNMDRPNKGKGGGKAGAGGRGRGRARGKGNNAQQQQDSFKAGDVVWAKVMGFNFWPAKVYCTIK